MQVNVFGIVVLALGLILIFLGVTGKYQAFVGSQASSTSSSTSAANTKAQQTNAAVSAGIFQAFGNPPVGALQAGSKGFVAGISQGAL